jgi:hypothetical protein
MAAVIAELAVAVAPKAVAPKVAKRTKLDDDESKEVPDKQAEMDTQSTTSFIGLAGMGIGDIGMGIDDDEEVDEVAPESQAGGSGVVAEDEEVYSLSVTPGGIYVRKFLGGKTSGGGAKMDKFFVKGDAVQCLREVVSFLMQEGGLIFENCAGTGNIIRVVEEWNLANVTIIGADIDGTYKKDGYDARDRETYPEGVKMILSNPPYSQSAHIIDVCLEMGVFTILLLPLATLTTKWFKNLCAKYRTTPDVILCTPAPKFYTPESPEVPKMVVQTAWFIWGLAKNDLVIRMNFA